jgi:hypothetical protein
MVPAPGEEFWLVKSKPAYGSAIYRHVYREDPALRPLETPLSGGISKALDQSGRAAQGKRNGGGGAAQAVSSAKSSASSAHAEWVNSLVANVNALTDAFALALQHAAQCGQSVKSEDLRTLLVTSFLTLSDATSQLEIHVE